MSSTSFAEGLSQGITKGITDIVTFLQNLMWKATEFNAKLWLWMPTWLKIVLLMIGLFIIYKLGKYAYNHREFWVEIIQGKY